MSLTQQEIEQHLSEQSFATVVTREGEQLASRTMLFGYAPPSSVFLITRRETGKVQQIKAASAGLIHVGALADDLSSSYDISIRGGFELVEPGAEVYREGIEVLARKNAMVRDIAGSSMRDDYALLRLRVDEILGWTYRQALEGAPKTRVSGSTP